MIWILPSPFPVTRLPESIPADFRPGDFRFPEVYPNVPKVLFQPPEQVGLDELFQYLLE